MKPGEKKLFFSLWAIIFVAVALWKFWPTFARQPASAPFVSVGASLQSIIASATVEDFTSGDFQVALKIHPAYLARLSGDTKNIRVYYRFMKEDSVLYAESSPVQLSPDTPNVKMRLANPARYVPKSITLSLSP